jgi:tetratricopeptide (TPR) repeat protein
MGKASRKKRAGTITGSGSVALEGKRTSTPSKAAPPGLTTTAALVAAVTFIVFLPALQNEFVNWDDDEYVYKNPFIRSINLRLFTSAFGGFHAGNWHPLTWISHAIDYAIWGLNPLGHHLMSIVLHALNTFLVVFLVVQLIEICRKTTRDAGISGSFLNDRATHVAGAVTGLFFGLHPLHVESVAWVSERKDVLCALFFLSSIVLYTRYVSLANNEPGQRTSVSRWFDKRYILAVGFFALALLSKPMAVSLPFVLLILDWYPFRRIRSLETFGAAFIEKLPFIALSLVSSALTFLAQRAEGAIMPMEVIPLSTRIPVAAKSLIAYIWKMIVPLNLLPFYPYPKSMSPASPEYMVPIFLLAGITAACFAVLRKQRLWISAWGYYVMTLAPVLGIAQVGSQAMADRYTYLPSLGPFLIAGVIAAKLYEKVTALNRWRVIAGAASVFIAATAVVSLSYVTIKQIGIWRNSILLWNYVIDKEPSGVPVAHNNLGEAYKSRGQLDKAIEQYQTALRLNPDYAEARNNLANEYASKGLSDSAVAEYQSALRLNPENAVAHYNLGLTYDSKGLLDKAVAEYQTALRLKPDYAEAHNNLGVAYGSQGLLDRAIAEFQTAIRQKPDFVEARYNLAFTYLKANQTDMAKKEIEVILRIKPDFSAARRLLNDITARHR